MTRSDRILNCRKYPGDKQLWTMKRKFMDPELQTDPQQNDFFLQLLFISFGLRIYFWRTPTISWLGAIELTYKWIMLASNFTRKFKKDWSKRLVAELTVRLQMTARDGIVQTLFGEMTKSKNGRFKKDEIFKGTIGIKFSNRTHRSRRTSD